MSEDEYVKRVAELAAIRLPDPTAEKQIRFYHQLSAPVWQGVEWIKEYLGGDAVSANASQD